MPRGFLSCAGKIFVIVLMLALLVTSWAFAGSSGRPPRWRYPGRAIRIAKGFFPVPAELSEFHPIIMSTRKRPSG